MNKRDPKLIALLFNECINNQDIKGLSNLMTEDHKFIDRQNEVTAPKDEIVKGWKEFFKNFPEYQNYFPRIESKGDTVIIPGYAIWAKGGEKDHAIWVAKIQHDCVAEWRIYEDTVENRNKFNIN
ncbi:MAG: nuclear transport factor 2 family protein [Candidatus Hodarchaeota archaeon]